MGLSNERRQPLQATHEMLCKFTSPDDDDNYTMVKNGILALVNWCMERR